MRVREGMYESERVCMIERASMYERERVCMREREYV